MSVADCSETSVLRLCTLQPYVPLRRGPSESGSAIRHIGLRRRNTIPKRDFEKRSERFGISMQKLFYEDIHMVDFTAVVTECIPTDTPGQFQVLLDRTAFFPEEGGQPADAGTLTIVSSASVLPVLDVQIRDNLIYHIVSSPISVGTNITGHVDWDRRFDFMQQHSGEHIISGLIHSQFGLDNVGFHLGLEEVTLDMNGELTLEQLRMIEQEANRIIWRNLPILISYPSPEELVHLDYRSKLDLTEDVRIVEIPGVDRCACCAPHAETTGAIGMIKITNVMRHRGGVRIHILCGNRALTDYTEKQTSVTDISVQLSAKPTAIADAVGRLREENTHWKEQYHTLQTKFLDYALKSLPSPEESTHAVLFLEEINDMAMRGAINELVTRYQGYCGIFVGNDADGYRFIIGSSKKDCRELAGMLREQFQAKGGGSAPMIQGSIHATKESVQAFFRQQ